jgi:glycosyltransferase involved in cell wall biosynthesis
MKILAFVRKDSSPDYHRITMPLLYMEGVTVYVTNQLLEEQFQDIDVFVYSRTMPESVMPTINKLRERYGFAIGVDVDDYWYLDRHHICYHEFNTADYGRLQINQLRNADFVTTTNERLALMVKDFNPDVFILPNAIPKQGQFTPFETLPGEHTRFFWQGSITHLEDIRLISHAIQQLTTVRNVEMVLAGHVPNEPTWSAITKLYTANGLLKHCLFEATHHEYYYQSYKEADVCLVPLVNSTFNRMKSNLKILEAANLGLPVIAHNVHPYKGLPVYYANGTAKWFETMKLLANSSAARFEAGQRLKEYCDHHFNYSRINNARKQVFEYYGQD